MALRIISADERLAQRKGIKGCIFGKAGIGKTSLLWTLKASTTLFMDLEAGDLAVEGWQGDTLRPRTWKECRDFAVFIGGPNPALRDDQPYSQAHFAEVCGSFGDPAVARPLRHDLHRQHHRRRAALLPVVPRPARGLLRQDRQAGHPRRLRPARPRDDRLADPSAARARQERLMFVGILDEKLDDFNRKVFVAADRRQQDRPRTARHRRSGHHHGRASRTRPASRRALRLPDAEPLGLSRQGPQRPARHGRGAASRPADREDPRPRAARRRTPDCRCQPLRSPATLRHAHQPDLKEIHAWLPGTTTTTPKRTRT